MSEVSDTLSGWPLQRAPPPSEAVYSRWALRGRARWGVKEGGGGFAAGERLLREGKALLRARRSGRR